MEFLVHQPIWKSGLNNVSHPYDISLPFFLIPHPVNIKVPDKISGLTGKTHPCLIFQLLPITFPSFFIVCLFKAFKQQTTSFYYFCKDPNQDQSSKIHFIFITVCWSVSFKKSSLQGFCCLWGFLRGANGAEEGLAVVCWSLFLFFH